MVRYCKRIDGLDEYDNGPNADGILCKRPAPSIGCGSYTPLSGDVIEFKYPSDYTQDADVAGLV